MFKQFRNLHFWIILVADVCLFAVALVLAYVVRYSAAIPAAEFHAIQMVLPWVILVKLLTFAHSGVYRGMWRYTSLPDAWRIMASTLLAMLIIMTGLTFVNRFQGYPRSVFLADSIFTLFFCGGIRLGIRLFFSTRLRLPGLENQTDSPPPPRIRLILIGAGDAADKIIREVQGNFRSAYEIVCCLDDDPAKQQRSMHDIPIRGPVNRLSHFAKKFHAAETLIVMPSVTGERLREIVTICEASKLPFRTLPSLSSLIDGDVTINDLRPVDFEDLLGRPAVQLDLAKIGSYLTGKTVAVTGAGGSIGSELCRQIIHFKPAALILIDASEYNLYKIEMELKSDRKFASVVPILGRVQDEPLLDHIFGKYRPQVVFHAAAYKHVPMVELNPWEAIHNNVVGSEVVMQAAEKYGVDHFVLISSDKAVRPTNVMGASKRVAEILLQSRPQGKTRFMAVRFGNVVGSSGSVIPLFQSQIKAGGPVTVTHPEMTRYFMTIPEACQLLLQTGALGNGGEIFVLEMGTPVKIADMARDLIKLSGKEPDRDIKIVYTGIRPGEKLYEELITHGEGIVPTAHKKIMVLQREQLADTATRDFIRQALHELVFAAGSYDASQIRNTLRGIVADYAPAGQSGSATASRPAKLVSKITGNRPAGVVLSSPSQKPVELDLVTARN